MTGLPKIPTNILSARLKELQDGGVVCPMPLRQCGLVYGLTEYGRELEQIVVALGRGGFLVDERAEGRRDRHRRLTDDRPTNRLQTRIRLATAGLPNPSGCRRVARPDHRRRAERGPDRSPAPPVGGLLPAGDTELRFATGPDIRHVIAGTFTPVQAVAQGIVTILTGDLALLEGFTELFRIEVN